MRSFNFYNPVQIYFGENAIENLSEELKKYGKNILLTYGGGSIKKSGIYDKVIKYLQDGEKNIYELAGIMPNPRTVKVYEGIKICKEHNIDFILAVGGGSVIDCSKYIAAGAKFNDDFWDKLIIRHDAISNALPLGVILTVAATGSEMNSGAVITNWEEKLKLAYGSKYLFPKF
jgi:alcohol dehydrogenase YqhD (iron-dependent ADH family)